MASTQGSLLFFSLLSSLSPWAQSLWEASCQLERTVRQPKERPYGEIPNSQRETEAYKQPHGGAWKQVLRLQVSSPGQQLERPGARALY